MKTTRRLLLLLLVACSSTEPLADDDDPDRRFPLTCPEPMQACNIREVSCQEHTFRATACLRGLTERGPYPKVKFVDEAPGGSTEPNATERALEIALSLATPEAFNKHTVKGAAASAAGNTIFIGGLAEEQEVLSAQRILAHEMTHSLQANVQTEYGFSVYARTPSLETTEGGLTARLIPEGEATFYDTMAQSALDGTPFEDDVAHSREALDEWLGHLVSPNARALVYLRGRFAYEAGFWIFAEAWGQGRHAAMDALVAAPPKSSLVVFGESAEKIEVPKHAVPEWATGSFDDELGAVAVYANAMRRGITKPVAHAWRGDRVTGFKISNSETAFVWTIHFATDADATAFAKKPPTIPGVSVAYGAEGPLAYVLVGDEALQPELRRIALGE